MRFLFSSANTLAIAFFMIVSGTSSTHSLFQSRVGLPNLTMPPDSSSSILIWSPSMISGIVRPLMVTTLTPSSETTSLNEHETSPICISKIRSRMYFVMAAFVLLLIVGSSGSSVGCV